MYRIHIDEAGRNGGRNRGRHRFLPSERLMSKVLSEQTIALVKATVPALQAHGLDIVRAMYARMFRNPTIRDLFNQSHHGDAGSQPKRTEEHTSELQSLR